MWNGVKQWDGVKEMGRRQDGRRKKGFVFVLFFCSVDDEKDIEQMNSNF